MRVPRLDRWGAEGRQATRARDRPKKSRLAPWLVLQWVPVSHRVFVGQLTVSEHTSSSPAVVDVFGPDVVVPNVVTEAPSNLALEADPETSAVTWGITPTGTVNR